jgi:hypothetical protein
MNARTKKINGIEHVAETTDMMQGGTRAECSCGWWKDSFTQLDAERDACLHLGVRHTRRKRSLESAVA